MKIENLFPEEQGSGFAPMARELKVKLNGMTINEALKQGVIDELGDDKGMVFFEHADPDVDRTYAIIQGQTCIVSTALAAVAKELTNKKIGKLRFILDKSNKPGAGLGQEYFRLGLPAETNLGEGVWGLEVNTTGKVKQD